MAMQQLASNPHESFELLVKAAFGFASLAIVLVGLLAALFGMSPSFLFAVLAGMAGAVLGIAIAYLVTRQASG